MNGNTNGVYVWDIIQEHINTYSGYSIFNTTQ